MHEKEKKSSNAGEKNENSKQTIKDIKMRNLYIYIFYFTGDIYIYIYLYLLYSLQKVKNINQ